MIDDDTKKQFALSEENANKRLQEEIDRVLDENDDLYALKPKKPNWFIRGLQAVTVFVLEKVFKNQYDEIRYCEDQDDDHCP